MIIKTKQLLLSFWLLVLAATSAYTQTNFVNQANAALKSRDLAQAESYLDEAEDHCGEPYKVQYSKATLAALSGDYHSAKSLLDDCVATDAKDPKPYYNRALVQLELKNFQGAIDDFRMAANLGQRGAKKSADKAINLKKRSEARLFETYLAYGKTEFENGNYSSARTYYDAALELRPEETAIYYENALMGHLEKNPINVLEALAKLPNKELAPSEYIEYALLKAYSLGRVNKMLEGVKLLERLIRIDNTNDPRPRELLSYYYLRLSRYDDAVNILKGQVYKNPITYVVAGNAAMYNRKFDMALRCYKKVKFLDKTNVNADIGMALCLSEKNKYSQALELIDSLAKVQPENFHVWNTRGIIYKDLGRHYKDRNNNRKANAYLITSAQSFSKAVELNAGLQPSFDNNKALALFFQDKEAAAEKIWTSNNKLASQNNLAILKARQKDFRSAYYKLDSLQQVYVATNKKKNQLVDHNRRLAKSRTRFGSNYKFVTYYFLTQNKVIPAVDNPFFLNTYEEPTDEPLDYLLMYSDKECKENTDRKKAKKSKKKRRFDFKLFKRKKKKQKGDCPTF